MSNCFGQKKREIDIRWIKTLHFRSRCSPISTFPVVWRMCGDGNADLCINLAELLLTDLSTDPVTQWLRHCELFSITSFNDPANFIEILSNLG